jgi:D-3-phosphoglycerate dehydrogenase / 2-oxoglutarate reductase
VATRLKAFEMEVVTYDPHIHASRARDLGVHLTDLETVLGRSDILTAHVPLTDEMRDMIAFREILAMKSGVRIVNCARGGVVTESALLAALDGATWRARPWTSSARSRPSPTS